MKFKTILVNNRDLKKNVLFAGYGGSDPHFEDIISDLNYTLNWGESDLNLPKCYILLKAIRVHSNKGVHK